MAEKISLKHLLEEIKKNDAKQDLRFNYLNEEIKKNDAKQDLRFNYLNEEIKKNDAKQDLRFNYLNEEIKKNDARQDFRFEFIKEKIQETTVGLLRLEEKVDIGFSEIKNDLRIVREQTANLTERVFTLENVKTSPLSQ